MHWRSCQDQGHDQHLLVEDLVGPYLAVEEAHFEDGEECTPTGPYRHVWTLQG